MALFHLAIGFDGPKVSSDTIQNALGHAGWARYAPNCWLVSTTDSAETIATKVHAVCNKDDSVFVVEVDKNNSFGWLEKEIWEWLKRIG